MVEVGRPSRAENSIRYLEFDPHVIQDLLPDWKLEPHYYPSRQVDNRLEYSQNGWSFRREFNGFEWSIDIIRWHDGKGSVHLIPQRLERAHFSTERYVQGVQIDLVRAEISFMSSFPGYADFREHIVSEGGLVHTLMVNEEVNKIVDLRTQSGLLVESLLV